MKLLVTSTITMTDHELMQYAERNSERAEQLPPEEFVCKIKNGEKIIIQYPDGSFTSYEIMADN